jgi:hypothetical protein
LKTFLPRLEILPPPQQAVWNLLTSAKELGFVLYGGTAIALRLGHRTSIDFDFFSSKPLNKERLLKKMPFLGESPPEQDKPNTFTVITRGVKFSFFGNLTFGCHTPPELTSDRALQVAALDDLLALKIKVIHERSERKDFQDIAALLRHGVPLERGLAIAESMFVPNLSPMVALRAITYFEGGDVSNLSKSDKETLVKATRFTRPLPKVSPISQELSFYQKPRRASARRSHK